MFEKQCERICALESKIAELVRLIKEEEEEIWQRKIREKDIRQGVDERMVWARRGREQQTQLMEKAVAEFEWLTREQIQRDCLADLLRVFE